MLSILDFQKKYYKKIDNLDLDLLIAAAIKKSREFILTHPEYKLSKSQSSKLKTQILRRIKHEPIAYILGQKEFYGLEFKVDKNTLIPRPETELIIEKVLKLQPKNKIIIDIGTGSGNIIISLAKNLKGKNNFFATDISSKALAIAQQNSRFHKVSNKIKFLHGSLLEPIEKKCFMSHVPRSIIIVTNLPYLNLGWKNLLKSSKTKGLKFEPHIALYAGNDGLDAYRQFANKLKLLYQQIPSDITILCEIGHLQTKGMQKIFSFAKNIKFSKDLSGKFRVAQIKL